MLRDCDWQKRGDDEDSGGRGMIDKLGIMRDSRVKDDTQRELIHTAK